MVMEAGKCYEVVPVRKPVRCVVEVPGSKSITNRALMLASMARGKSVLTNALFSDDTRGFMDCLESLGYELKISESEKKIELYGGLPSKKAAIDVRGAGTSARFLTALLAASEGEYTVDASDQMKSRPMKPLTDALAGLGCTIDFFDKKGFLPYRICGGRLSGGEVTIDAEQSSQFTSALLMTGCLHDKGLVIKPAGKEIAKPYIDITMTMMEQFGVRAHRTEAGDYTVEAGQAYVPRCYAIEPDVSNACYFYAAAALTGGSVTVKGVYPSSMQGDIRFLDILENMGSTVNVTDNGISLVGPDRGIYDGIEVDMNDCSDQVITLAALAPFASSPTIIKNIQHIKHQESNRVRAVLTELSKMGIRCAATGDGIVIYPGAPKPSVVETYDDHRMAMAFALIGLRAGGIRIANPSCTAKTFENYFDIFDCLYQ